jgi:hypothetical protein
MRAFEVVFRPAAALVRPPTDAGVADQYRENSIRRERKKPTETAAAEAGLRRKSCTTIVFQLVREK